jgi:hypothetical protein
MGIDLFAALGVDPASLAPPRQPPTGEGVQRLALRVFVAVGGAQ